MSNIQVVDLSRVHRGMSQAGIDLLLVNQPENVWYLSGYPLAITGLQWRGYGRSAVVLVPRGADPILVPGKFEVQITKARAWVKDLEPFDDYVTPPVVGAAEAIRRRGLNHRWIGIEREHLCDRFGQLLQEAFPDSEFVRADDLLAHLRARKGSIETAGVIKAYLSAAEAAASALNQATDARREIDLRNQLAFALMRTFWTAQMDVGVVSGPRISIHHGQAGERQFNHGDWIRIECTIVDASYPARVCRMGTCGSASTKQQAMYSGYVDACTRALGRVTVGMTGAGAYDAFRKELQNGGHTLLGGVGFGLGYGVVEPPYLAAGSREVLEPGMTLSLEPMTDTGIGVNWTVLVEDGGLREVQSSFGPDRLFAVST
jgi:Xaa-Pro aminopeptidase